MIEKSTTEEVQRLHKRVRQLKAFLEASTKLTSTLNLKMLMSEILSTAVEVLEIENSSLWLLDDDNSELVVDISVREIGEENFQYRLKVGEGIAGKVAQTGEPLLLQHPG